MCVFTRVWNSKSENKLDSARANCVASLLLPAAVLVHGPNKQDVGEMVVKMTTRQHVFESGRKLRVHKTDSLLKKSNLGDETLQSSITKTPSPRTHSYEDIVKYISYMNEKKDDRSLGDRILNVKMNRNGGKTGVGGSQGGTSPWTSYVTSSQRHNSSTLGILRRGGETLIVFGAANVSASGFLATPQAPALIYA